MGPEREEGTLPKWVAGFTEDGRLRDYIMVGDIHFDKDYI
jgi:hypothetical protein